MSHTQHVHQSHGDQEAKPAEKAAVKIHRVCIGCNNMFEVTMDQIDAKHCPTCHKG